MEFKTAKLDKLATIVSISMTAVLQNIELNRKMGFEV